MMRMTRHATASIAGPLWALFVGVNAVLASEVACSTKGSSTAAATPGAASAARTTAAGRPGAAGAGTKTAATVPTDPNLKIAFVGDTGTNENYVAVLRLVEKERAQALVVEGDMSYEANADAWWDATESVLGRSFPVFVARGNHDDSSWQEHLARAARHLDGAVRTPGAHDANYGTVFRGLVIATIRKGDTPANLLPFLENDDHIWKICSWHQNQAAMQVGEKGDEMGWDVYEACRRVGAIIETGHEHTYHRTKTLTDLATQTVDPRCGSASELCVGPGRTFVNVVGLGGESIRPQARCLPATPPYGCKGEWAFIYTENQSAKYGAQFITFNAGDPYRAVGAFETIDGEIVDRFTITHDR
jgi:hypothetical protein